MQQIIQTSHTGKQWIQESICKGLVSADICSAYIRSEAFRYFFEGIFNTGSKIRVLARWASNDLLSQASDLATYRLCKENNIAFYIKQDFHGKLYGLDPHGVLLGSFNLTNRGFSISNAGNDEAGVLIESNQSSSGYFNQLFSNAKLVDDLLFEKMLNFIEENEHKDMPNIPWTEEITNLITPQASQSTCKLLVNECFATTFNEFVTDHSSARQHDLSLLGIEEHHSDDVQMMRAKFRRTKIFSWFIKSLDEQDGDVYFGKATALLHDQLFDDPRPYRQEVKNLLANLLSWIEGLGLEEVRIDRPNHSQRMALNKEA